MNLVDASAGRKQESEHTTPRICMPSFRNVARMPFQCGRYEAQDVLAGVDAVEVIDIRPTDGFRFKARWQRRLMYRDVSKRLIFQNPGLQKVRLARDYDVFMAVCSTYWDLPYLNAIEGWKDRCKTSVCSIDEMWVSGIPYYKYWLHFLNQFDYVFVGFRGTTEPLAKAIGQPCHWIPAAVDALRFTPYPKPPARVIDVYSVGRRGEGMHRALRQAAERGDLFYVHDTFRGEGLEVADDRQHRDMFASMAKRSQFFLVAPTETSYTQGQVEIAFRYFEGAAAGTVMIGQAPKTDAFPLLFPWQDAVVHVERDGSDTLAALAALRSQPERVSAIRRRNTAEALLRHDWVYRWKEIFRVAGIQPLDGMAARERLLKEAASVAAPPSDAGSLFDTLRIS